MLQELKSSEVLDLLFICAKSQVEQVSKPAVDCLVLIWQWYLRRSPSASFSLTRMSCFLPEEAEATSASTPATAPSTASGSATAVASAGRVGADTSQLWSVTPVVNFGSTGATPTRPYALQLPTADNLSGNTTASPDLPPKPRVLPGNAMPPSPSPAAGMVRVASGSLPAFSTTHKSAPDLLRVSPSSSSGQSWLRPERSTLDRASNAAAGASPQAGFAQHRAPPASSTAELRTAPANPQWGGEAPAQPDPTFSSFTSSSAPNTLSHRQNLTASNASVTHNPLTTPNRGVSTPSGLVLQSLEQQSVFNSSVESSSSSWFQQARRHSMSSPNGRRSFSSLYFPFRSRSMSNKFGELQVSPKQAPIHSQHSTSNASDHPQSSSREPEPAAVNRAQMATAPKHALPEGTSRQANQGMPLPTIRTSSQPAIEHKQPEPLQYIQSWLDTDPEGHWQPLALSQPFPVKAKADGLEREPSQRLERQSPAQLPPTPDGRRPTQRALQFSLMSVTQPGAEVLHDNSSGNCLPSNLVMCVAHYLPAR